MSNKRSIIDSNSYWTKRYGHFEKKKFKGASGNGRMNFRLKYKANVINTIIRKCEVKSVIDYGCGDGLLINLLTVDRYHGIEISQPLVDELLIRFKGQGNYQFGTKACDSGQNFFDLALSIDVIFHLLEDDVYNTYLSQLFNGKSDFVLIKSSNHNEIGTGKNAHIRHRFFLDDVCSRFPQYELIETYGPRRKHIYFSISDRDLFFLYKILHT